LLRRASIPFSIDDVLVRNWKSTTNVIPAKAGIQMTSWRMPGISNILDPGGCPGPDPGFARVTTLSESNIKMAHSRKTG